MDTAMVNEVAAKVLCHNLVVLIHEMYKLGIAPLFEAGSNAGFASTFRRSPPACGSLVAASLARAAPALESADRTSRVR